MQSTNWQITVSKGLKAHFKQQNGQSRPGTDWSVAIRNDSQEYRIFVRVYVDEKAKTSQEEEVKKVNDFVADLLRQGWKPESWKGEPGELTLDLVQGRKPWWRFW